MVLDRRRALPLTRRDRNAIALALRRLEPVRIGLSVELDSPEPDPVAIGGYAQLAKRIGSVAVATAAILSGIANAPTAVDHLVAVAHRTAGLIDGDTFDIGSTDPRSVQSLEHDLKGTIRAFRTAQASTNEQTAVSLGISPRTLKRILNEQVPISNRSLTRLNNFGSPQISLLATQLLELHGVA